MSRAGKIARRTFLLGSAAVAGGLAFGYYAYRRPPANPLEAALADGEATFNPYVKIAADNAITIIAPRAEMGQGIETTLAALVAEELDVDLDQVQIEHGPAAAAYANIGALEDGLPFAQFDESTVAELARKGMAVVGKFLALQMTGGSTSTTDAFERMRRAGATARETLKAAAAERLDVPASSLSTAGGRITHAASGRSLAYGDVALAAAAMRPVADVPLRSRSEWRLLGKPQPRTDMRAKVTGAPIFGVDVSLPDMVFATVRMNPHLGAPMRAIDAAEAENMPGVIRIVPIETHIGNGYAVIARSTWHALRAANAVRVDWAEAAYPPDEAGMWKLIEQTAAAAGSAQRDDGDVETEFADAPPENYLEAEYRVPWLAHACMEPMNATAWLRDGRLDVWAPNQVPTLVRSICADAAGVAEEDCAVHTTYLGGGFGRRTDLDYALYAAKVALHAEGRPVKVTWSREEDITHDMYRPAALARMRARLADDGRPSALDIKVASPSIMASLLPRFYPSLSPIGPDKTMVDGAFNQPYAIANYRVAAAKVPLPVPVGVWRSVGNSINGFFHECFLDEIAHRGGLDPVEMRLQLMAPWPTAVGVVEKVAAIADWGGTLPDGHARGFAFTASFGSWVAEIVEIARTDRGIRLEKVWIAADVGTAIDPRNIEAQLVSGAIFGLSAAMNQAVTFSRGAVEQSNFHDFDAMRMFQCPAFEVAILENAPKMGGVGEIGTPPAAPALANAVFALTGTRIRQLPLSREVAFA